jgi:hypothetical protein
LIEDKGLREDRVVRDIGEKRGLSGLANGNKRICYRDNHGLADSRGFTIR